MFKSKLPQATPEQLEQLRDPAAVAAIEQAHKNGWLTVGEDTLASYFGTDTEHPVRKLLAEDAEMGGDVGMLQFVILLLFFLMAFGASVLSATIPPVVFVMWCAIGVTAALLSKKHSRLLFKAPKL